MKLQNLLLLLPFIFFPTDAFTICNKILNTNDTLNDSDLIELFTYMHKQDVSLVNKPEIRQFVIENNFNTIVKITKIQGFPSLEKEPKKKGDSFIIYRCSSLTFHHILLDKAELLLNEEIITLFKTEVLLCRMPRDLLLDVMLVVLKQNSLRPFLSMQLNERLIEVIQIWQIINCDK